MDKHKRVNVYEEEAVNVVAYLEDFDGDVKEWKIAFYELWREQMTWSFAYEIVAGEHSDRSVYVCLKIRPKFKKALLGAMEQYGYRNIKTTDITIGIIEPYETEGFVESFDEVYVEW